MSQSARTGLVAVAVAAALMVAGLPAWGLEAGPPPPPVPETNPEPAHSVPPLTPVPSVAAPSLPPPPPSVAAPPPPPPVPSAAAPPPPPLEPAPQASPPALPPVARPRIEVRRPVELEGIPPLPGLPGLPPLPGPVQTILENVRYRINTTYRSPDGDIQASTEATPYVPALVDVDRDLATGLAGAELLVLLTIDAGRLTLLTQKLPLAPDRLPLRLEVVLQDPRPGEPFRFAYGYDTLDDTAPDNFQSTVSVAGVGRISSATLDFTATPPSQRFTLFGQDFTEGPQGQRIDPQTATISYTPGPSVARLALLSSEDPLLGVLQANFEFTTDVITLVNFRLSDVSGPRELLYEVDIDRLPRSLRLDRSQVGDNETWTYQAGGVVDALRYRTSLHSGPVLREESVIEIAGMAPQATLRRTGEERFVFTASQPLGIVELRQATGGLAARLPDPAYVYQVRAPGYSSFTARVLGLSSADVQVGDVIDVTIQMQPGPFRVLLLDGLRRTEVLILDLPDRTHARIDAAAGQFALETSQPVGRILAEVTDPGGVAGRATLLRIDLRDLPTTLDLTAANDGSVLDLDARGQRIGSLDAILTSGPEPDFPAGFDGVVVEDVEDHYVALVHLAGLRRARGELAGPLRLLLQKDPGPFLARLTQGQRFTEVQILDLPSSFDARFDQAAGTLGYVASDRIGHITALVTDPAGVSGRATRLQVGLDDLPPSLSITFQGTGGVVDLDAQGSKIGRVGFLLTSGPEPSVDTGYDGVIYEDLPTHFAVTARLTGLYRARAETAGPFRFLLGKDAGPFVARLLQGDRSLEARIHDIPQAVSGASIDVRLDPSGSLTYSASGTVREILATLADPAGIGGRATRLSLALRGLPTALTVTFSAASGVVDLNADPDGQGTKIASIELLLTSGPEVSVDPGYDGVIYEDLPTHFAVTARLTGLSRVMAKTTNPARFLLAKDAGPVLVRARQGDRFLEVRFLNLPQASGGRSVDVTLDQAGSLTYDASATVGRITVDLTDPAGVMGRATALHGVLESMPTSVSLTFPATGGVVDLDAHDAAIGKIELLVTSGPAISVDSGFDGFVYEDLPTHFAAAARITGLRRARVETANPFRLLLSKAPGPVVGRASIGSRFFEAKVLDAPATMDVSIDSAAGSIVYTASDRVGEIGVVVTDSSPFFGRANRLQATLTDLPTALTVTFPASGGRVDVDARGSRIGRIELLATSGPVISVDAGFDGVVIQDVSTHYALAAQLNGLRRAFADLAARPNRLLLQKDPGPFIARLTQGSLNVLVRINDLPSSFDASVDPSGTFTYTASAGIGTLFAELSNPAGVAGRATLARATLTSLPASLQVTYDASAGRVVVDAGGATVGSIEVLLTSGPGESLDPSLDGAIFRDLSDRYVAFIRFRGLRKIDVQLSPVKAFLDTTGGRVFFARIEQQKPDKVEYLQASLDRLVPGISLELRESPTRQEIFYSASSRTNGLSFETNSGDRWVLQASLSNPLPASVYICQDDSWYCSGFGAHGTRTGSFGFSASEHTDLRIFDCVRPLSPSCPSSPSEWTDLNWRVRVARFDADFDDFGFSGHTHFDTDGYELRGRLHNENGSGGGFDANFPAGFWAQDRRVSWSFWGTFKDKSGSINCPGGTSLSVRVLGFWVGVTSFLC